MKIKDGELVGEHSFVFNPDGNGGEQISLQTKFRSNGKPNEIYWGQELSLESYGSSAAFTFGDIFTPENLRKLADELDDAASAARWLVSDHPFKEYFDEPPKFNPEPWYNPYGDSIQGCVANEAAVTKQIDWRLALDHSYVDNRIIGFRLAGITKLLEEIGVKSGDSFTAGYLLMCIAAVGSTGKIILNAYADAIRCSGTRVFTFDEIRKDIENMNKEREERE